MICGAFWSFCVGILAAVVIEALAGLAGNARGDSVPAPSVWPTPLNFESMSPWSEIIDSYLSTNDVDGVIALVKTSVVPSDRSQAIEQLLRSLTYQPPRPPSSTPPASQIDEKNRDAVTLADYRKVHAYIDTWRPSRERQGLYAVLAAQYKRLGDKAAAKQAYEQLAADLAAVPDEDRILRLRDYFGSFFNKRIVAAVCGLMAVVVFFLRPTVEIRAKAFASWFYSNSKDPHILKALGGKESKMSAESSSGEE